MIDSGGEEVFLRVKTLNGVTDVKTVTTINVSNGTLTDNGDGSVTIVSGGGGGGGVSPVGDVSSGAAFDGTAGTILTYSNDSTPNPRYLKVLDQTTNNTAGNLLILQGAKAKGTAAGGAISILGGAADTSGNGGNISLISGLGAGTGHVGNFLITANDAGSTSGKGGNVQISAGNASGGNSDGGDIDFFSGLGHGSGVPGKFLFTSNFAGATGELNFDGLTGNRKYTFADSAGIVVAVPNPAANTILGWDNTDTAFKALTIGTGLTYTHSTHTLSASGGMSIGGTVTSGTTGNVLFVGAGPVLAQDGNNFFYNASTHRLGLGTATPSHTLDIQGAGAAFSLQGDFFWNAVQYKGPSVQGAAGSFLSNDGAGQTSWVTSTSTAGGSPPQIQWNNSGALDGVTGFEAGNVGEVILIDSSGYADKPALVLNANAGFTSNTQEWKNAGGRVAYVDLNGNIGIRGLSYTWPSSHTAGYLKDDGSGGLSWTSLSIPTPGGSQYQVQSNDGSGGFTGTGGFYHYPGSNPTVLITGQDVNYPAMQIIGYNNSALSLVIFDVKDYANNSAFQILNDKSVNIVTGKMTANGATMFWPSSNTAGVLRNDGSNPANLYWDSTYVTDSSTATFTNKSGNISQWTNNSGYINGISIGTSIGSSTTGAVLYIDASNNLGNDGTNFFWDASNKRLGILTSSPNYSLDVNGLINTPGTTANTYRWNTGTTAPLTNSTPVFTSYYGGNTNALGDPIAWALINIMGTDYKVPAYL